MKVCFRIEISCTIVSQDPIVCLFLSTWDLLLLLLNALTLETVSALLLCLEEPRPVAFICQSCYKYLSKLLQVFVIVSYRYLSMLSHVFVFVIDLTLECLPFFFVRRSPVQLSAVYLNSYTKRFQLIQVFTCICVVHLKRTAAVQRDSN